MQVTKGSQPSGMPVKREIDGGILIRPFLPAMKADLYSYVAENKLHIVKIRVMKVMPICATVSVTKSSHLF